MNERCTSQYLFKREQHKSVRKIIQLFTECEIINVKNVKIKHPVEKRNLQNFIPVPRQEELLSPGGQGQPA
jgi:hypothetical protein